MSQIEIYVGIQMNNISLNDIYDKNINFLIGSGASYGLFPTLAVDIKGNGGEWQSIETLATHFEQSGNEDAKTLLFMYYFNVCIKPVMEFDLQSPDITSAPIKIEVINNYRKFLDTVLTVLQRKKEYERKCNIFTTNYDGCFSYIADEILKEGAIDFTVNDGARGFRRRYLQAKNYNSFICQTGIFDRHRADIPQVNLIPLHGSVYWKKDKDAILVDYSAEQETDLIDESVQTQLDAFSAIVNDNTKKIENIPTAALEQEAKDSFWGKYKKLPIVNPTKWKFHETVFEEHYYQMLRLLSYELEKPNSVLITFGFSFADEHILNLLKRSLSNPSLQVFICCFNQTEHETMQELFKSYKNVSYVQSGTDLNFTNFNQEIFSLKPASQTPEDDEVTISGEANE